MKQIIKRINKATKVFLQKFSLNPRKVKSNLHKCKQQFHISSQRQNRLIFIIFLLLGIMLIGWFIWEAPQRQVSNISNTKDRITVENAIRGNLVQAFGGLFLFVTGYLSWRNLQVTQEKQVTERFAKAVEQLGSENIHVRLGAIYALERIAKDSDKDYWQVMEILTAYVRERAPYPSRKKDTSNQPLWLRVQNLHKKENYLENTDKTSLETDIQAVLTVLSRRNKSYARGEVYILDLSGTNLSHANLSSANLSHANLSSANLSSANLSSANLSHANLSHANLSHANLSHADLSHARLSHADLSSTILYGANLNSVSLNCANLSNSTLVKINLSNANLSHARLSHADLSGAVLTSAHLGVADLRNADLTEAVLGGADLWDADLSGANLSGTVFFDTDKYDELIILGYDKSTLRDYIYYANIIDEDEYVIYNTRLLELVAKNITPIQILQARNCEEAIYSPQFDEELYLFEE